MANIASFLKSEISRLARKEIRAETESLKKASAQYSSDIAALKRRLAEQDRLIAQLRKGKPANDVKGAEDSPSLRFRADGFASLRKKLDLSAAEMGNAAGCRRPVRVARTYIRTPPPKQPNQTRHSKELRP